jgi:hypothetical protein
MGFGVAHDSQFLISIIIILTSGIVFLTALTQHFLKKEIMTPKATYNGRCLAVCMLINLQKNTRSHPVDDRREDHGGACSKAESTPLAPLYVVARRFAAATGFGATSPSVRRDGTRINPFAPSPPPFVQLNPRLTIHSQAYNQPYIVMQREQRGGGTDARATLRRRGNGSEWWVQRGDDGGEHVTYRRGSRAACRCRSAPRPNQQLLR